MAELNLFPQSPGRPAHLPPSIIIISEVTTGFFGVQRAGPRQLPFGAGAVSLLPSPPAAVGSFPSSPSCTGQKRSQANNSDDRIKLILIRKSLYPEESKTWLRAAL